MFSESRDVWFVSRCCTFILSAISRSSVRRRSLKWGRDGHAGGDDDGGDDDDDDGGDDDDDDGDNYDHDNGDDEDDDDNE